MSENMLMNIARNVIAGFLLSLGMAPSEGDDTLEVRDSGPHRVFTQQAQVPPFMADDIDAREIFALLLAYIDCHNALPMAIRFNAYSVEIYVCPCGCGTFLYISIYQ